MKEDGEGWNQTLLAQLFSPEEIQIINRTPISSMGLADRLVWIQSKHGQYTVDSGYKLAKEYQKQKLGDEGTSHRRIAEEKVLWNGIWDMKIKKNPTFYLESLS